MFSTVFHRLFFGMSGKFAPAFQECHSDNAGDAGDVALVLRMQKHMYEIGSDQTFPAGVSFV